MHLPSDDQFEELYKPSSIKSAMKAAEAQYAQLDSETVTYLRARAKRDKYFLAHAILGYNRLSPRLHGSLCDWLQRTEDTQYRMILLPRSHYKTTLVTITDAIQAALPGEDDSWPRGLGTNIRILLAHESHEGATRFLYEVGSHFLNNPRLMGLFSECIPSPRLQRMNKFELELPRSEHWAEPTFDTMGVGGLSQGRHWNLIKLDDLFGARARDSKAERDTTIQWFDNIQSFLIRLAQDHIDLIGTRYSLDDVYEHAMKVYGPKLLKYIRRIKEHEIIDGEKVLRPIFPEEFTEEALEILKKNPKVWNAQYVNDPREGQAEFNPVWKRWYFWTKPREVAYFSDQANGERGSTRLDVMKLDRVLLVDPAVHGKSGLVATASDDKMRLFVLEAIKRAMSPPEFVDLLFALQRKWWFRCVAIEDVAFSAVYKPWIEREMRIRNIRFTIIPIKPRRLRGTENHSKPGRVKALANYFSAGQIFFNEGQHDLIEEYDNFGATDDYHLLDALAQGPEVWRAGLGIQETQRRMRIEEEMLNERDFVTGYSQ